MAAPGNRISEDDARVWAAERGLVLPEQEPARRDLRAGTKSVAQATTAELRVWQQDLDVVKCFTGQGDGLPEHHRHDRDGQGDDPEVDVLREDLHRDGPAVTSIGGGGRFGWRRCRGRRARRGLASGGRVCCR